MAQQNSKKEALVKEYDDMTNELKEHILKLEEQYKDAQGKIEELKKINTLQKDQLTALTS